MSEQQNENSAALDRSDSKALLVVNNQMIVEMRHPDGSLSERYAGPSVEQIKAEHGAGRCGAFCGHCYHEAMEWLAANDGGNLRHETA